WGLAGYSASGGNFRTAELAAQSGQQFAHMGRDATRETTETVMNGYGDRVLDMYRCYATSTQGRGQSVLPIDKWYGSGWDKAKQDLHFTSDYERFAQDYYVNANRPLASVKTINVPLDPQNFSS